MTCTHNLETLEKLRSYSLRQKVFESRLRIAEWVQNWGIERCYVSFSGGRDSTALLDIVRRDYPDMPAVFVNTGVEFPEIVQFVRDTPGVEWLRPKLSYREVLDRYGYPVISKKMAQYIGEVQRTKSEHLRRLRLTGIRKDGSYSRLSVISKRWQYLCDGCPFRVSDKCCHALKRNPINEYQKRTGRIAGIVGMVADESDNRLGYYLRHGCNAFDSNEPRSNPLMFWTHVDILEYAASIAISPIYSMGYESTGCVYCAFGAHLEPYPNRFQRLQQTHPGMWQHMLDKLGWRTVLEHCQIAYRADTDANGQGRLDLFTQQHVTKEKSMNRKGKS